MTLKPSYRAKNRPLETIEELLSIRWFNGRILYGEDYNRNGYLDSNEDDGPEGLFPPDNGDGILDRGLLPYITILSWDHNWANDNKPRLNINQVGLANPEKLPSVFKPVIDEVPAEAIQFIADIQKIGYKPRSIGDLVGLQVYSSSKSNHTKVWTAYDKERNEANKVRTVSQDTENSDTNTGNSDTGGTGDGSGTGGDSNTDGQGSDGQSSGGGNTDSNADAGSRDNGSAADKNPNDPGTDEELNPTDTQNKNKTRTQQAIRDRGGRSGRQGSNGQNANGSNNNDSTDEQGNQGNRGGRGRGGTGRDGNRGTDRAGGPGNRQCGSGTGRQSSPGSWRSERQ